jgi:hypothetical protein
MVRLDAVNDAVSMPLARFKYIIKAEDDMKVRKKSLEY